MALKYSDDVGDVNMQDEQADLFDKHALIFDAHQIESVRQQLGEFSLDRPHSLHGQWSAAVENYLEFYGFLHAITSEATEYFLGFRTVSVTSSKGARSCAIATHYWRTPGSTSTVFLLHGLFDHVGLFQRFIGHLIGQGYSVVSFDLPGHGLSSGEPAVIESFGEYAQVLDNTLKYFKEALAGQTLCAVGQSTGAAVLMLDLFSKTEAGVELPFERAIFMGPLIRPANWRLVRLAYTVLHRFVSRSRRDTSRPNTHDRAFHHFLREHDPLQSKAVSTIWVGALKAWIDSFKKRPKVALPLLVVQGTDDHVVDWQWNTQKIQQHFVQSELRLIEGARHHLLNEALPWRAVIYTSMSRFLKEGSTVQAPASGVK